MYSKSQRIAAIIGIILLLLLYAINFFIGIFCNVDTFPLFLASLLATFFIPVIIFCYITIMKHVNNPKDTIVDDNDSNSHSN